MFYLLYFYYHDLFLSFFISIPMIQWVSNPDVFLPGQKPSSLSKEGKQIKKLLNQGATDRKAHTPKFDPLEELPKKKPYNSTCECLSGWTFL